jgi:hypothetical protein
VIVTSIRNGLKARLDTIAGLTAYARVPKTINLPAAVVRPTPGTAISYDATMADGAHDLQFLVTVLITDEVDELGQELLDDYLATTGAKSIRAAIATDDTLGAVVHFSRVVGVTDYGEIEYAGLTYIGADFLVEVTAT